MTAPVVYVDVKKSRLPSFGRPQPWYWVAKSATNNRKLARSTERYTNYADVLHAVDLLFGEGATIYRREAGRGNVLVRLARV